MKNQSMKTRAIQTANETMSFKAMIKRCAGMLAMLTLIVGLLASNAQAASIAAWDFSSASLPVTQTATVSDANLTAAPVLSRGSTAAASSGTGSFRTVGFKNDGISTANTDYFQTSLTAASGDTLSLSTIDAVYNGTQTFVGTGGVSIQWAYSLDGTTFTLVNSPVTVTGTVPITSPSIDLSGVTALQNVPSTTTVTLRFYASGQTATGGWGFYTKTAGTYGLVVSGAVNPPAPSAPTVNAASITNTTDFTASWNAAATATGYQLDVATDSGFTSPVSGYSSLDVGNVLTTSVTGLTANTIYYYRVRAYNGGGVSGNSTTVTVKTLSTGVPKILVTLPGEGSPNAGGASDEIAGTPFSITLTATTDGTTVNTGYTGTKTITFTGPTGSPVYPSTVSFTAGVGTATVTLKKAESPTITATASVGPIAGKASSVFNVVPGAVDHYVVTAGSAQVVGIPFNVAFTAFDANGNIVTTDNSDSVTLSSTSGTVTYDFNPATLANGTNSINVTDSAVETITLTATDSNSKTGVTGSIVVSPVPQYRTKQSGNWGDFTTWQINAGSGFVDAVSGQTPTFLSDTIEIRTNHTVTVAAPVIVDQVTVDAGATILTTATLTVAAHGSGTDFDVFGLVSASTAMFVSNSAAVVFESGSIYQHNLVSGGAIPFSTWAAGSTCVITNQATASAAPSDLGQMFYNFTWDCPAQGANLSMGGGLINVLGNLRVTSTGTKEFRLGASTSPTLTIGGNWIITGGTNVTSTGTGSPIINVGGFLSVKGTLNLGSGAGTTTINAGGNVSVSGLLTKGSASVANVNFAKTGTQNFTNIGTITGAINWTVNDNSTLVIAPGSTVDGTGTFTVSGAGTVAGSGTVSGPATINGTAAPGTATTIGTLTFTSLSGLNGSVIAKVNRNGGTPLADEIVYLGGTINYSGSGTLLLTNIGASLHVGDTFTLFSAAGYGGGFGTTVTPDGVTFDTSALTSNGTVTVTAVTGGTVTPIPLSLGVSGSTLTFTWSDSSFTLQSSTNVAGPYAPVPGAASGYMANTTGAPQMYYRLSHP